jgi:CRISPR/Cas system-associated protein Cas10 (large subunit of type III CRISPR-Cas system)
MSQRIVAFDTDRIKEYVFGTGTLKEIRGASALLDQLNREEMLRIVDVPEEDVIYANGGAGLFVMEEDRAEDIIQAVQRVYREETSTASITGVSVPLPVEQDGVADALKLIRYHLRAAKDGKPAPMLPLTHSLLHFCDSCGTQYATETYATETEDGIRLCQSCAIKRDKDRQLKEEIDQWTASQANPDPNSSRLWERLIGQLKQDGYPIQGHGRPDDFNDLGDTSHPRGYMALIYADGDGMGKHIDKITSLDEMKRFSEAVDQSVYQAVQEAIVEHLQPEGGSKWPFDILLLGGDDLVMVTRAQSAMDVVQHIVRRFPELTEEGYGERLALSASVVLTHVNFPIGPLMALAESGLKFAKREAARRRRVDETLDEGLINFLVVSSANHLDFKEYYKQTLRQKVKAEEYYQEAETIYRTQRPHTADECEALLEQIRELRRLGIPRTKLEQLRAAVFKSRKQATIDAMMAILRLRNENHQKELFKLVGSETREKLRIPWVKEGEGEWTTPILDVVELFDFVRGNGKGGVS